MAICWPSYAFSTEESVKQQQDTCRLWRKNSLLKAQTLVEKAQEDLDAWSLGMPCLMPHLQLPVQGIFEFSPVGQAV